MYEWGRVGRTESRLFQPTVDPKTKGKASFRVNMVFTPSTKYVPLTKAQSTPGPSGQVVKKRYKFFTKASTMELGHTVIIRRKSNRMLAFGEKEIMFSAGPVTVNYSRQPTAGQFNRVTGHFFNKMAPTLTSNAMAAYSEEVARKSARAAVQLTVTVPSDNAAKLAGANAANTMSPVSV